MVKWKLEIEEHDFAPYAERGSYSTRWVPVFGKEVESLARVKHVDMIRHRGYLSFRLNPQDIETNARLARILLDHPPVTVVYHCLQRNQDVVATMLPDAPTMAHLSYCLAYGKDWTESEEITLEEL